MSSKNKLIPNNISLVASRTFASVVNYPDYRLYFFVGFFSQIGFWMQASVQSWLILQTTGSGKMMAILVLCEFGPYVLLGLVGGTIATTKDTRKILLWSQIALTLLSAVLAVWYFVDAQSILYAIFAAAILRSLISCITVPVGQTFTFQIVGKESIKNALALNTARMHFARILGPMLAGWIISRDGIGYCFILYAFSFICMFYAIYKINPRFPLPEAKANISFTPAQSIKESLKHIWTNNYLIVLIGSLFFITFIPMSFTTTLPIFALETLQQDSTVFGFLFASLGIGSFLSSLVSASLRRGDPALAFAAAGALGIAQIALIFERSVVGSAFIICIAGFSMTFFVINITSNILTSVEDVFLGRITVLTNYVVLALGPFGSSVCGWLSDLGGSDLAFAMGGLTAFSVALFGLASVYVIKLFPTSTKD